MSANKRLFIAELPYIGEVSMLFYVPDCDEKDMLVSIIEKYGGRYSGFHECCTFQINPAHNDLQNKDFFVGEIFRSTWLTDTIKAGELLDKEDYLMGTLNSQDKKIKKLTLNAGQSYTISETIKIQELASIGVERNQAKSSSFWQNIQKQHILPDRNCDSMRNFFKKQLNNGLRQLLEKELEQKAKFSHYFTEIPRPISNNSDLTRQENEYIKNAPPKMYNQKPVQKQRVNQAFNDIMRPQQNMSMLDQMNKQEASFNMKSGNQKSNVVAYNLKDLSSHPKNQQSLGQVFDLIDQSKSNNIDQHLEDETSNMGKNKENDNSQNKQFILKQDELMEAVEKEQILVFDEEKRQVNLTNGQEAYFALLAHDLLDLADKYKRDIDEVHQIFFEVSCERDQLIKVLEGQRKGRWMVLEDLALKDDPTISSYQYVVSQKEPGEVEKRKMFLEIQ